MAEATLKSAVKWVNKSVQKFARYGADNAFLEGPYAPVKEETTCTELKVSGSIPTELNGILARIGPNPIEVINPATHHWFVGDGMVHGVRLEGGKALWYRNRWVGSNSAHKKLGKPIAPGPRRGLFDSVNTNVIGHAGEIWALVEAGALPVAMDNTLETTRHGLFNSTKQNGFSAHPHRDPLTGELHTVTYDPVTPHKIYYLAIDAQGQLTRKVSIPVKHGPMIHDCAITRDHVLILDLPVTFSITAMLRGATLPYRWNKRHPARVGLLPKKGNADDIRWFQLDPCFVFHTGNAFTLDDGSVIVDVVAHKRMFDRSIQGPEQQSVTLERWTLPANGDSVIRTVLATDAMEFPRYDERLSTQEYRYLYTSGFSLDQPTKANQLFRFDVTNGNRQVHHFGDDVITYESVFVPRQQQGAEDDGWLMSYTYNLKQQTSAVVILNADDIEGPPQATIELPTRVPMGFHGNWIPCG